VPENPPDVDAQYLGDGRILYGGGYAVVPTVVGLDQVPQLVGAPAFTGRSYHHHVEQLPDGRVVALVRAYDEVGAQVWDGFGVTWLSADLSTDTQTLRSQDFVDDGTISVPPAGSDDPWHANALIDDGETLYVNLRQVHLLVAIDEATRELAWTFGPGGDFTLLDDDGLEADSAEFAWGAHAPELEGDRLLMYDNGYLRPGSPDYSRVVEFELDVPGRTARVVWAYTEPDWFEQIWGDVDRLPDGRVLFVRAHCEGCGGKAGTTTQVVVVDPVTNQVDWRLRMLDPLSGGYRAQALDGCDVFSNEKYCPD